EEVGVAQGVVAEALGDVGGEADVGGGEAVFTVDVAGVHAPDGDHAARLGVAVVADELGHRPRLPRWAVRPQPREMADEDADEFAFAIPEAGEEFAFLLGGEQVGGENRGGSNRRSSLRRLDRWALTACSLHGLPSPKVSVVQPTRS